MGIIPKSVPEDPGRDDVFAFFSGPIPILFRKQKRDQHLFHLPLHVAVQHIQEDMGFHPIRESVVDWSNLFRTFSTWTADFSGEPCCRRHRSPPDSRPDEKFTYDLGEVFLAGLEVFLCQCYGHTDNPRSKRHPRHCRKRNPVFSGRKYPEATGPAAGKRKQPGQEACFKASGEEPPKRICSSSAKKEHQTGRSETPPEAQSAWVREVHESFRYSDCSPP